MEVGRKNLAIYNYMRRGPLVGFSWAKQAVLSVLRKTHNPRNEMKILIGILLLLACIVAFLWWLDPGTVNLMDHNEEDEK